MRDYAKAEDRARAIEDALHGDTAAAAKAEQAERYSGVVRIERGPAAYRVTFPQLSAVERGTDEARNAWDLARRPMADVKAIIGRRFDKLTNAWIVPLDQGSSVEILALDYGATIEQAATDDAAAARIAELERQLADLQAAYEDALAHDCAAVLAQVAA